MFGLFNFQYLVVYKDVSGLGFFLFFFNRFCSPLSLVTQAVIGPAMIKYSLKNLNLWPYVGETQ